MSSTACNTSKRHPEFIGKPLPYLNNNLGPNPDDMACWRDDLPYLTGQTNNTYVLGGFVTWPFATDTHAVTALDWASDIRFCGEAPETEAPPTDEPRTTTASSTTIMARNLLLTSSIIWFSVFNAGFQ